MAEEKKQKNPLPDRFVTVQAPTTYSGTIKKALSFVSKSPIEAHGVKGMKSTPWRKTFKTPENLDKWADANQAEVHATREIEKGIVKPDLKPTLKPEAKEALKDWYRDVYKVTKAFRYTCGNCGHSDAVHTIGGHPQPKSWGCARCKADTTDIKPLTEAPVARGKFKTEPVFSDEEKKKVKETGGFFKAEDELEVMNMNDNENELASNLGFRKAIDDLPVSWKNYLIKARNNELVKDLPAQGYLSPRQVRYNADKREKMNPEGDDKAKRVAERVDMANIDRVKYPHADTTAHHSSSYPIGPRGTIGGPPEAATEGTASGAKRFHPTPAESSGLKPLGSEAKKKVDMAVRSLPKPTTSKKEYPGY